MSKLGDFVKVQGGYAFKSSELSDDKIGVPVIKIGNITGGSFVDLSNYQSVSFQLFEKTKSFATKDNDILIAMTGANVGKTSRVPVNSDTYLINQRVGRFLLKDDCPYTSDFIYYVVSSKQAYQYFSRVADGAAQPNISGKTIEDFEFPNLDSRYANKIGDILKSLDDKIQLNSQINQTLEQIAQTIFKSWFIDFDPVHAKAEALANGQTAEQATQAAMAVISGKNPEELHRLQTANPEQYQQLWEIADTFPSGVDEEGVPWGWEERYLKDVCNIVYGKNLPTSELKEQGYPVFGGNGVIGFYDKYLYDKPHTLVSCRGAASGKVIYSLPNSFVTNNSLVIEHSKSYLSSFYVYEALSIQNLTKLTSGSAQPQMTIANMNPVQIIVPTEKAHSLYFNFVKGIYDKKLYGLYENEVLSKIRNELLPKLLSGEILNGN
ncbi:restriction endonuclease subunit S [Glaesserella parasuis]|uniref:restriction endonuclease subunit S n=1 Tax=Glaesserella parasuis TaxID=738 RepID=UPI00136651FD|nr:restriction endonuclease subunit S [Glaesserella parasuis]MCT8830557.1 restriction endonuclease subunit S [Glaesserella parasuis]MCT8831649.1 restriction endonuclease subunit S [Glaesserella parasuis]MCT8834639.1 restriction endonuclease subunit S [Glaesserella parasuis]MCT8838404.1 restriction endonuclease subunit S [Glaesserella parasuis]MCT8840374.1 restriction endonuclease subunit S [Glaesserella parasuis]